MMDILSLDTQLTLLINGSDSAFIDGIAWYATRTITWIFMAVVLLYIIIRNSKVPTSIFIIIGLALSVLLADQVASGVFKPLVQRFRPTHDPNLAGLIDTVNGYKGGRYGFFSSHASNTFAIATFVTMLIRNKWVALTAYSFALINCWTRVYLGVHFVGDILAGIAFGLLSGWFCYQFTKHNALRSTSNSVISCSRQDIAFFVSSFILTLIYIVVRALL